MHVEAPTPDKAPLEKRKTLRAKVLGGSMILLSGSGMATVINLLYNIAIARSLGPAGYGHASAIYTLLTVASAITLSFQLIATKLVARYKTAEEQGAVYRTLHRAAWVCGLLAGLLLVGFATPLAAYLQLPSATLVRLLAVGIMFYVPLGTRRGYIQGAYGFRGLAANLVLEGAVRLLGSMALIFAGWGVEGVIAANSAAVAVAYLAIPPKLARASASPVRSLHMAGEMGVALVFFSGQVLINNSDIVMVKHFFTPRAAGLYAAVAMVGRVMFALSQAVVNSMFPLVAGTSEEERRNLEVIGGSLLMVLALGLLIGAGLSLTPSWVWTLFFGPGFALGGLHGLSYLMTLYAATTVVYCLSVVIITYEMSYKIAGASWVQLAVSGVLIAALWRFHASLEQVIVVQLWLMVLLFVLAAIPFLLQQLTRPSLMLASPGGPPLRIVRRVSEDEAIAAFLAGDWAHPVYDAYRAQGEQAVEQPNFDCPEENRFRRALLSIRHLALWSELPRDTSWYELELSEGNLDQIQVFPRAQWRNLARRSFGCRAVAASVREHRSDLDRPFAEKLSAIREHLLEREDRAPGAVLLIGSGERDRLTILDGNHRLVAAISEQPLALDRLRVLCGFSPRMKECCWYETNFVTLLRYGRHVLGQAARNPRGELDRLLAEAR